MYFVSQLLANIIIMSLYNTSYMGQPLHKREKSGQLRIAILWAYTTTFLVHANHKWHASTYNTTSYHANHAACIQCCIVWHTPIIVWPEQHKKVYHNQHQMKHFSAKPSAHCILKVIMLLSTVRSHQVSRTNVHYADWLIIIAQTHSTWSAILLRDVLLYWATCKRHVQKIGRPASWQCTTVWCWCQLKQKTLLSLELKALCHDIRAIFGKLVSHVT